jgi:PAS domain S-box-containing protein
MTPVSKNNPYEAYDHKQFVFKRLLWGAMIIVSVVCAFEFVILPHNYWRWLFIMLAFDGASLLMLLLSQKGYTKAASYGFIYFSLAMVLGLAWTAGGIKSPAIYNLTLIPLVAGLLLGWRVGAWAGFLSFSGSLGLVIAEYLNAIPTSNVVHHPMSYWIGSVFTISILSLLQYLSVSTLDKALASAENELELRKKADAERDRSNALRNLIFEGSGIATTVVDEATSNIIDCNNAAVAFFRAKSKADIIGKSPFDFSDTIQANGLPLKEVAKTNLEKILRGKESFFEWKHLLPNGETWIAEVYSSRFRDGDRNLLQFTSIDISERKMAQQKLAETQSRLKSISDNFTYGMFYQNLLTPDGKRTFRYLSESVKLLYGVSVEEAMADSSLLYNRIHPDDIGQMAAAEEYAIKHISNFKTEARVIGPDGKVRWSSFVSRPTQLPDGSILWDGLEFIITDRKEIENDLKESEGLFRNLIQNTPYHILLSDIDNRIVLANKAFLENNHLTEQDVIGLSAKELGMSYKREDELFLVNELKQKGVILNYELEIEKKNGYKGVYLFSSRGITYKNNPMFLTTTVDVTKLKTVERELETYKNHLQQLVTERTNALNDTIKELQTQKDELQSALNALNTAQTNLISAEKMAALGVLSAGIAHEINNPLNFIHGGALAIEAFIEDNLPQHTNELAPFFGAIETGVKRAADIVSSLSHYSRSDELPLEACDLHLIIDNCLIMLQSIIKNKIEINKKYAPLPLTIHGNEGQLHQVFLNILTNAAHAIEETGTITIASHIKNNTASIIVTDNGCGIANDNISRIFDPFFTTKPPGKGTGLGLSIAYRVVKEHRGSLTYESTPGIGTKARVELPLHTMNHGEHQENTIR